MGEYKYKIIIKKTDNNIVNTIYEKVNKIQTRDRDWLVYNLRKYVYDHLRLPLYEIKDIEGIICNYGIQKAIQYFILNKKIYEDIMTIIDHDDNNIVYGIAYYIIYEYFEYRIITN